MKASEVVFNDKISNRDKFGTFVRNRRMELGISVRDFAESLGLSAAYISDIESERELINIAQKEWKVQAVIPCACSPIRDIILSFISFAALLVKVIASISKGLTSFSSIKYAILCVITRVLPEPAPARISTGPSVW